jgi:hypothetical protein
MDHVATRSNVRFWTKLGIRLLRFFGVGCAFVGYFLVLEWFFVERHAALRRIPPVVNNELLQWGCGLMGLGVPHVLAANRLQTLACQADAELAREMEPGFLWLLTTSLILPGAAFVYVVAQNRWSLFRSAPLLGCLFWLFASTIWLAWGQDSVRNWTRTLLLFTVSMLISMPLCLEGGPPYVRLWRLDFLISAIWLVRVLTIYFGRGDELRPWDRTFLRWGWMFLFCVALPVFLMVGPL